MDTAPAVPSRKKLEDWLLTPEDVADALGITTRQVLREVEQNRLQCDFPVKLRSGKVRRRFTMENVLAYVQEWAKDGNPESVAAAIRARLAA